MFKSRQGCLENGKKGYCASFEQRELVAGTLEENLVGEVGTPCRSKASN